MSWKVIIITIIGWRPAKKHSRVNICQQILPWTFPGKMPKPHEDKPCTSGKEVSRPQGTKTRRSPSSASSSSSGSPPIRHQQGDTTHKKSKKAEQKTATTQNAQVNLKPCHLPSPSSSRPRSPCSPSSRCTGTRTLLLVPPALPADQRPPPQYPWNN